jgi:hypothetical protein
MKNVSPEFPWLKFLFLDRWLFYIEGALTCAVALLAIFILPDFPERPQKWLSEDEQALALHRMTEDVGVGDNAETEGAGKTSGLVAALTDWKVWWMALALTSQVVALSFNAFFPTLAKTLGYNDTVSLLLCAPPWVFATLIVFFLSRSVMKSKVLSR